MSKLYQDATSLPFLFLRIYLCDKVRKTDEQRERERERERGDVSRGKSRIGELASPPAAAADSPRLSSLAAKRIKAAS